MSECPGSKTEAALVRGVIPIRGLADDVDATGDASAAKRD